jgi:hypothetical protein
MFLNSGKKGSSKPGMADATNDFHIIIATTLHHSYSDAICEEMERSALERGTGIAKRSPEYIRQKMDEGKAVIALSKEGEWAGFCYIETWGHGEYVANSGLIVAPRFRKSGLAKGIKKKIFNLSRTKYPEAKIFGLTTGLAVMKINSELGYEPVTYSELTQDEEFWKGCRSCVNYDILMSKERKNCLCTAMLFEPPVEKEEKKDVNKREGLDFKHKSRLYERWMKFKQYVLLGKPQSKNKLEIRTGKFWKKMQVLISSMRQSKQLS